MKDRIYLSSRKRVIFIVRLLVTLITGYMVLFSPGLYWYYPYSYLFVAAYLATNLWTAWLPEKSFHDQRIFYFFVFFDTLMIIAGIYISGREAGDFYLVYFLLIALSTLSAQFSYLLVNSLIFASLYAMFLWHGGYLQGPRSAEYLLRIPFIVIIVMFYGMMVNIIIRDRERRLKAEQEKYQRLFASTDVSVFTVDRNARFVSANPKYLQELGIFNEKELFGKFFGDFHGDGETREFVSGIARVFESKKPVKFDMYDSRKDRWKAMTLSPVFNDEGCEVTAVSVISKDITDRVEKENELKAAYDTLKKTRDELIQKDKLAALGRMASGIAHEIRNPLEIIAMGLDYLDTLCAGDNPKAAEALGRISAAVDRANRIIENILRFARKSEVKIEKIKACAVVKDAMALVSHRIKKSGVEFIFECADENLCALADPGMISQVLVNLVSNAIDAMEKSDEKKLTVRVYQKTADTIGYRTGYRDSDFFKIGDRMVVIEVSDTGEGIDKDDLSKIFEPFFTTKGAAGGTGLGLALCHSIMEQQKGIIDVQSKPGRGAVFYLYLQSA